MHPIKGGREPLIHSKRVFRFRNYSRLDKACANTNAKIFAKVTEQVNSKAQGMLFLHLGKGLNDLTVLVFNTWFWGMVSSVKPLI